MVDEIKFPPIYKPIVDNLFSVDQMYEFAKETARHNLKLYDDRKIFLNPGWSCPKCGRGNAPFTYTCPCVPNPWNPIWCNNDC